MNIEANEAVDKLVDFLKREADLDTLALLYSEFLSDKPVILTDCWGESDKFLLGERVLPASSLPPS